MKINSRLLSLAAVVSLAALLTVTPAWAATFEVGKGEPGNVTVTDPISADGFLVGNNVTVSAPIKGEAFLAGNSISLTERPERSVYAAGNTLLLNKGVGYNLFAAGNTITISGEIGHDVYVAGNTVTILPGTVIHGDLRLGANTVNLAGTVEGDVLVGASSVTSSAVIKGDLRGQIQTLAFSSGSIGKDLDYKSAVDAKGLDKVTVAGLTIRHDLPVRGDGRQTLMVLWLTKILFEFAMTLVAGFVLIWLLSSQIKRVQAEVGSNWGGSLVKGASIIFLGPVIIIIAALTIIGLKVAVILGLLFALCLIITGVLTPFVLGQIILIRGFRMERSALWQDLLTGVVVMGGLSFIPVVNFLIGAALFIGVTLPVLGSFVVGAGKQLRS